MKALKPINVKIGTSLFRLTVGCDVPQIVEDYWKKENQVAELVKNGSISGNSETKQSTTVQGDNVNSSGNGKKK